MKINPKLNKFYRSRYTNEYFFVIGFKPCKYQQIGWHDDCKTECAGTMVMFPPCRDENTCHRVVRSNGYVEAYLEEIKDEAIE